MREKMSIKRNVQQYFSPELSADKRLFHVALVLGGGEFFLLALMALLLRINVQVPILLLAGAFCSMAAIYAEHKSGKMATVKIAYLFLVHIILVPLISYLVPNGIYDFPVYFITGVIVTAILLTGRALFVFMALQMAVDLLCIYRMTGVVSAPLLPEAGGTSYDAGLFFRIVSALLLTGMTGGIMIAYRNSILRRVTKEREEKEAQAKQVSYAKDMFLVNVSHEIRTPLNAILGTTELVFDLDTVDKVKENAFHIANASRALLSITKDLMDFSKMNDDGIEICKAPCDMEALFDELLNMFSVQFTDYKTELFVDIAPDIPRQTVCDGVMLKRMLFSLLTGIVKTMDGGAVFMIVKKSAMADGHVNLFMEIVAQGTFLRSFKELLGAGGHKRLLENEAPPVDDMVQALGGELIMEEADNERNYYFTIPLNYAEAAPLVEKGEKRSCILFYENTALEGSMFAKTLKSIGLEYSQVFTGEQFFEKCRNPKYTHIMIAVEHYEEMKGELEQRMNPQTLILISTGITAYDDTLIKATFARPVSCLNIHALLCNKRDSSIWYVGYKGRFECPDARILVVDDNIINLEVASGILSRYKAHVLMAASGRECLDILQQERVDMIFLDYMMPEMDGIDTLKEIRAMELPGMKKVPVIALTANAVSGAREMFMDVGFDEYISKPIELDKLEKILRECMAAEKIVYMSAKEDAYGF